MSLRQISYDKFRSWVCVFYCERAKQSINRPEISVFKQHVSPAYNLDNDRLLNEIYTVVSAYKPPGYKTTSALVPLKEFPDCFCYPLHAKVSLFNPAGCKHKPASVLRNCPPKHAKNSFVSRLLKIIC